MGKVYTLGSMVAHMKDLGKTITCTDKALTHGVMVESTKENITWIKSTVTVSTTGLMGDAMKDTGRMESSMEKANTFCTQASLRSVSGRKARE